MFSAARYFDEDARVQTGGGGPPKRALKRGLYCLSGLLSGVLPRLRGLFGEMVCPLKRALKLGGGPA